MRRMIAAAFAFVTLAAAGTALAGDDMEQAMALFESGHYVDAQAHLRAAALGGDAHAAEILGFMYRFGSEMFPGAERDGNAAAYWFDLAARRDPSAGQRVACAPPEQAGTPANTTAHCLSLTVSGQPGPR